MHANYWKTLEQRRLDLGVEFPALAERSGVSIPALKRLFSGKSENPTLRSLQGICRVLGVELRIHTTIEVVTKQSVTQLRENIAREKAERLVRLVQGTSALESQAVGTDVVRDMISQTVHELLAGSNRRLWAL